MALDFPASPTNGQEYQNWIYSSSKGAWQAKPLTGPKTITADVPPLNPQDGDQWYNTLDGTLYVWVVDIDGGQWVESQAPITANGYYSPNYIINGDFSINQRNFTSSTTAGSYPADRWFFNGSATTTGSRQTFTPGSAPVPGYEAESFVRLVTTGQTGAAVRTDLIQRIEDIRTLAGKTITVSFWAKAGSGTPSVSLEFAASYGAGGSPSAVETAIGVNKILLSGGTTWNRYSATINMPSLVGKTIGTTPNTSYWSMSLWVSAGTDYSARTNSLGIQNNTFDFWGVQVEEGATATTFRRNANSIQGELAACQRYYYRMVSVGYSTVFCTGGAESTTGGAVGGQSFPVEMRAIPTPSFINCSVYSSAGGSRAFTVTTGRLTTKTISLDVISSGLAPGQVIVLYSSSGASSYVEWNAEL